MVNYSLSFVVIVVVVIVAFIALVVVVTIPDVESVGRQASSVGNLPYAVVSLSSIFL